MTTTAQTPGPDQLIITDRDRITDPAYIVAYLEQLADNAKAAADRDYPDTDLAGLAGHEAFRAGYLDGGIRRLADRIREVSGREILGVLADPA